MMCGGLSQDGVVRFRDSSIDGDFEVCAIPYDSVLLSTLRNYGNIHTHIHIYIYIATTPVSGLHAVNSQALPRKQPMKKHSMM